MKTTIDIRQIAEAAGMIVDGYAFSAAEDDTVRIINLHGAHHAAVIRQDGEVLETNMDDRELRGICGFIQENYKEMYRKWAVMSDRGFYEK